VKWTSEDMSVFREVKDYIDTVILPLFPISFEDNMESAVNTSEIISHLTIPIEKKFKGRLLLLPAFTYLKSEEEELPIETLLKWEDAILNNGFKHIVYLAADRDWSIYEGNLEGSLYMISIDLINEWHGKYRNTILKDQVQHIQSLLTARW
jgi:hypothetical protein